MIDWSNVFAEALSYGEFLDSHANQSQRERWDAMHARFALTPAQQGLLNAFTRRMPVICLTGAWCGDCINQCPVFDHLAQAAPVIELRFLDRDALPAVREELMINGGARVPVVVFLSEDWQEVSRYGERTLSIYRKLAADQLGPSCPTGLVPPTNEALATITAEWLAEFELRTWCFGSLPGCEASTGIEQTDETAAIRRWQTLSQSPARDWRGFHRLSQGFVSSQAIPSGPRPVLSRPTSVSVLRSMIATWIPLRSRSNAPGGEARSRSRPRRSRRAGE